MSEESGAEKSFDPTPRRLEKAREKGETVKSADLSALVSYLGLMLAFGVSALWLAPFFENLSGYLAYSDRLMQSANPTGMIVLSTLQAMAGILVFPALFVVAALLGQQAFHFTPDKLAFKLNRISPLAQAKSKFGSQGLVEFLKATSKVAAFLVIWIWLARGFSGELSATSLLPPLIGFEWTISAFFKAAAGVCCVAAVIAAADYLWQRFSFLKRNRMTRQDITEEQKESEGDPHFKQQRRARATALAMTQIAAEVPQASVIIVNPTHYAVALKWDAKSRRAPVCVAKGMDALAAQIRKIAQENGIPIQSDPPTARALYAEVEIGHEIGRGHYKAVAAAIRFAQAMKAKGRK